MSEWVGRVFQLVLHRLQSTCRTHVAAAVPDQLLLPDDCSLDAALEVLEGHLAAGEAVLNIHETGHKENGQKSWTWCSRAQLYTLFRSDKSRGSKVLVRVWAGSLVTSTRYRPSQAAPCGKRSQDLRKKVVAGNRNLDTMMIDAENPYSAGKAESADVSWV